jgi:hypothetical protein
MPDLKGSINFFAWRTMDTAPEDGTIVEVYAEEREDLLAFITLAAYHSDAGWCVDEFREPIAWRRHLPPRWSIAFGDK